MKKKKISKAKVTDKDVENYIEKKIKGYTNKFDKCSTPKTPCNASGGCFYFIGFIGAVVYYISTATGFWNGLLGVLKALVWPAFLVYEALKFLGMQ